MACFNVVFGVAKWERQGNGREKRSGLEDARQARPVIHMHFQVTELLRMYQLTGQSDYLRPALRAWRDIVENRLYITGTTTTHETFRAAGILPGESADEVGEGCVSAHWVFLNRLLLHTSGETKYADEIEKTLYNHLLGSNCPSDAHQAYFTALNGNRPFESQNIWGGPPPCCLLRRRTCAAAL
jgi:DUF1680 family protein